MTFQYNSNATYSTKDLASSNSTVELVTQKIYLNESESIQLKFMDILKDHEIILISKRIDTLMMVIHGN